MIFNHPEYFAAIVEAKSLMRASEQLYVSQPYLSQYIKRLEGYLGVELFNHRTSPLRLTWFGEQYYQYVCQMLRLSETIRREFHDVQNFESGRLRLGLALWRGSCLLPDVFPVFHKKYPKIHLELTEGRSSQLETALLNDKLDIAVMNLPLTLSYNKLICETIFKERILLAVPAGSACEAGMLEHCSYIDGHPCVPLPFLSQIPLILTKPGQNFTHAVTYALGKNNVEPNILLETANLTTAINLAATGIACTFVPAEGAKAGSRDQNLTYFIVDLPEMIQPVSVVYPKTACLTRLSKLFIETLKEVLGDSQRLPAGQEQGFLPECKKRQDA
ncbi:MAG: LysR family transcriptional regulator [Lachnospiraceae bacterium]|nr:LysR family transcriptional regulator [Lachnospiraceae bacterium]